MSNLIYVVDDEKNISTLIKTFLDKNGFESATFDSGEEFLVQFENQPCDLVILDIMMQGLDGYTVCSKIRENSNVPIIFLSARDSEYDKIAGLKIGGDDYITKPFSPLEIVERVRSILRRVGGNGAQVNTSDSLIFKDITITESSKRVTVNGNKVALTLKEFDVLSHLIRNKNKAVSRDELLNLIWGIECDIDTRVTDDTIKRLRKKLVAANCKATIDTVRGFGFMMSDNE